MVLSHSKVRGEEHWENTILTVEPKDYLLSKTGYFGVGALAIRPLLLSHAAAKEELQQASQVRQKY